MTCADDNPMTTNAAQPYDVYAKLEDPMGVLGVALAQWETRDDSKAQPEVPRTRPGMRSTPCSPSCTSCAPGWWARSGHPTTQLQRGLMPCWRGCGVISDDRRHHLDAGGNR